MSENEILAAALAMCLRGQATTEASKVASPITVPATTAQSSDGWVEVEIDRRLREREEEQTVAKQIPKALTAQPSDPYLTPPTLIEVEDSP